MALTINTRSYVQDRIQSDRVDYAGPANTLSVKDQVSLSRVYPKKTGTFAGVAKGRFKFVKTFVINATTGETADTIFEISSSVPVGTASADVDGILADIAAWINTADSKSLYKALDINA